MAIPKRDIFQAIADPTRREILKLLAFNKLPITVISNEFPISRTAVSKHLRILEQSNLVSIEKVGKEKRYRLEADSLTELKQWLSFFEQFWDNKMSMLRHYVETDDES